MRRGCIVLDVGKTLSKLTLFDGAGRLVAHRQRANATISGAFYRSLDAPGIEAWLCAVLREFAALEPAGAIVTIAHGAAAAVLRDGALVRPPMDYEDAMPDSLRASYAVERDGYADTGSPFLPNGLNLGSQFHWLEALFPDVLAEGATIVPWPQYWGWLLSGVAASELTSLGCHSDLWRPADGMPSALADRRGWSGKLAPLRHAGAVLGPLRQEWVERTGLPGDVLVHVGLHDSNAALLAARDTLQAEAGDEATALSTGTWFVAMRSPGDSRLAIADLPAERDVLVNVDIDGRPVPSARFMGGREIERLRGVDNIRIDDPGVQNDLIAVLGLVIASGSTILPSFVPGVGPFPDHHGVWLARPDSAVDRAAAIALYAALVADVALDLIGARQRILVEGRFARSEIFVRALATLRPDTRIEVGEDESDVASAACRLVSPTLWCPATPRAIEPLDLDVASFRASWISRLGDR